MSSCEEPKKAARQPTEARPIARKSRGASGSAGGASSKVSRASARAAAATAATIQKSGRQASASACRPPIVGPRATAPKMQTFMIITVVRSLAGG